MFEELGNFILGAAFFTVFLMIVTFPAWLAGLIAAWRTRILPVPFFYRLKPLRWASWYLTGIIGMVSAVLAMRPVGSFEPRTRIAFVCIAVVSYLLTAVAAFYISWTASAKRRSRKLGRDSSDPLPMAQGIATGSASVLPSAPVEAEAYRPAVPSEAGSEGDQEAEPEEYPRAQPAD